MALYDLRAHTNHKAKNREFLAWCISQLDDVKHDDEEKILDRWAHIISYPHRLSYNPDLKLQGLPSNYQDRWNTQDRFESTENNCVPCSFLPIGLSVTLFFIVLIDQLAEGSVGAPLTISASIFLSIGCLALWFANIERFCRQSNESDIAIYMRDLLKEQLDQYLPENPKRDMLSFLLENMHRINFKTGKLRACTPATSSTRLLDDIERGEDNPAAQNLDGIKFAVPVLKNTQTEDPAGHAKYWPC